jgi:hypothetical protein
MSRLLKVSQAREVLGKKSDGAVYHMVKRGLIPPGPLVRFGREIQFNEDLLIEWIKNGGTAGAQKNETRIQTETLASKI